MSGRRPRGRPRDGSSRDRRRDEPLASGAHACDARQGHPAILLWGRFYIPAGHEYVIDEAGRVRILLPPGKFAFDLEAHCRLDALELFVMPSETHEDLERKARE